MLLNEEVMKSANAGNRKGYFATFFIPPVDDDECVFQDIVKTEREWRPETSHSNHTSASSPRSKRVSKSPRGRSGRAKSSRGADSVKKGLELDLEDVDPERDRDRVSTARSTKAMSMLSWGGYSETTPPPPPSRSAVRNRQLSGRPLGRGQPIKYAFDQGKAFATSHDRTKMTSDVIKEAHRGGGGDVKERTCRPYSSYTVYHKRENIAISPYGEPNLKGAAGRYREQYQSLTNSLPAPCDVTKESRDYVFKKFFENLTVRATLGRRSPIGVLKKPPPKPVRKPAQEKESKITHLHKQAKTRMSSVKKDLDNSGNRKSENDLGGVEYVIAMEMSHNLEKHRVKRSYSFPSIPTAALAAATTTRLDAPRLTAQSVRNLTSGEQSIRGGIETNLYEDDHKERAPITFIHRKPRVRSPPLSKLSRDRFLPQAIRRREMERQDSIAGLRIGGAGANTPVTDWKTESDRRPKSSMTATTKMQLESMASKTCEELSDCDHEKLDIVNDDGDSTDDGNVTDDADDIGKDNGDDDVDIFRNIDDCAVEEITGDDERKSESKEGNHAASDVEDAAKASENMNAGDDATHEPTQNDAEPSIPELVSDLNLQETVPGENHDGGVTTICADKKDTAQEEESRQDSSESGSSAQRNDVENDEDRNDADADNDNSCEGSGS